MEWHDMNEPIYGHRARIGYTSVAWVTEVFPYSFYRMAPEGVSLALVTILQDEFGKGEMDRLYERTMDGARRLARTGVDILVLGGRPVLLAQGAENIDSICARLSEELGVPVTTDASAQLAAFRAVGARRVGTVHPFDASHNARHDGMIGQLGLEASGSFGGGSNLIELPRLSPSAALDWGRELMRQHPDTDTILFPCPHWAVVEALAPLEREFGVTAISNLQATLWHALRTCGIDDRIKGFGRLLEEF